MSVMTGTNLPDTTDTLAIDLDHRVFDMVSSTASAVDARIDIDQNCQR